MGGISLAELDQERMALICFLLRILPFVIIVDWMKLLHFDRSGVVLFLKRLTEDEF